MNRDMSSSKVMLSSYNYSHTYELEYSYCVIILIYELVYSLCVMKVAHLTLRLTTHITYIIRIRAKLRWWFIVPSGVPESFTCRSVGLGTLGDLGSFCICKCGAWVWRDRWMHCPFKGWGVGGRWWQPCPSLVILHVRLGCKSLNYHMRFVTTWVFCNPKIWTF